MSRPSGARNHDFCEKRAALLDRLTNFALTADLRRPSLRQFAIAVHQSEPTLRHYFGDRQGLVIEILENIHHQARPIWAALAAPSASPAAAVEDFLTVAEDGMRNGYYTRAHAFGLIEGFADEIVGKVYLEKLLDPALQAFSEKLRATPGGPRNPDELRAASVIVTAPLFVLAVHQELLGGNSLAPIDMSKTLAFLKAWQGRALTPNPVS